MTARDVIADEKIDAMGEGDFYHYMLDKDQYEWAKRANRMSGLGLNSDQEELLATWFANAQMAVVDRPCADLIKARLEAEHEEDRITAAQAEREKRG